MPARSAGTTTAVPSAFKLASISLPAFQTATLAFSVWELYVGGVRPLDFVGFLLLIVAWVTPTVARRASLQALSEAAPVVLIGLAYIVAGVLNDSDNVKAALGVAFGLATFLLVYSWPISRAALLRVLTICLVIHLTCFWVQLLAFRVLGVFVNYLGFAGLQPRAFSQIFRPTGLFMEPATYSLFSIMMVALRYRLNSGLRKFDLFIIVSAIASFSLWGFVASAALLCWTGARRVWFWIVGIAALGFGLFELPLLRSAQTAPMLARLGRIGTDASARERYGAAARIFDVNWQFTDWFGNGITSDYVSFGENGWSYILVAIGLAGMISFLIWVSIRSEPRVRFFNPFVIALCLTAGSLWTGFWWWWWVALLTRRDKSFDDWNT